MGGFRVALIQPRLKFFVEILQRRDFFQRALRNELVNRFIEPLLLPFALGIARPCVHQLNAQQSAGTFHPVRPVLRTVVEIEALRRSVFHNSLVKRIFHNRFRHVAVEFAMENHAGSIVNQARKVGRGGKPVNLQRWAIFNVPLPQVVSVQPLKTL